MAPKNQPLVEEWMSIAEHLDEDDLIHLLTKAKQLAQVRLFAKSMEDKAEKPMLYVDSPRGLKLTDFIEREWLRKGFSPRDIDRKKLAAYDEKLVRAIENYEYSNGILPESLRFPKVGNRRSKKEMVMEPQGLTYCLT